MQYNSENVSLFPALVDTVLMVIMALAIATPLGIFAAVYLVEYASRGNRLVSLVRVTADTLAGIPSIVYGLFGMLFFVTYLKWGLFLTCRRLYCCDHDFYHALSMSQRQKKH